MSKMGQKQKILIVEDEYITAKSIAKFLSESGYNVVAISVNIDEAISILKNQTVDLILLDINLNEEKDGIWLANYINAHYQLPFIFLTAYSDKLTITNAIESDPYSYLVKPFQKAELFSAIELAVAKYQKENDKLKNSILLKDVDKYDVVEMSDIEVIESVKNYLFITTRKKEYKYRATIKEFLEKLPETFIQVHRGFIVNSNKIESIDKKDGIILIREKKVPISKTHKKETIDYLNSILF